MIIWIMSKHHDVVLIFLFVVNEEMSTESRGAQPRKPRHKAAVLWGFLPSVNGTGVGRSLGASPRNAQSSSYPARWHQLSNHLLLFARGTPLEDPNNFCLYCSTSWLKRISVLFPLAFFLGTYK